MRKNLYLVFTMFVLPILAYAEDATVAIPSFDFDGRINIVLLEEKEDGNWSTRTLALPKVHGREVNAVDFANGRLVLGSVLDRPMAENDLLPWVSACLESSALRSAASWHDLTDRLSQECPFNTHLLTTFQIAFDQEANRLAAEVGENAKPFMRLNAQPNLLLSNLNWRAQDYSPFVLLIDDPDSSRDSKFIRTYSFLYLLDFTKGTSVQVAGSTEQPVDFTVPEIMHGRYLCFAEKDAWRATEYECKEAKQLRPGLKGIRAVVFDIATEKLIFKSEDSFLGLPYDSPSISPQGTHLLWQHSNLEYEAGNGKVPHGDAGVSLFDVASGGGKRITPPSVRAFESGWFPDGRRFFYIIEENGTGSYYLGDVEGDFEKLELSLDGVSSQHDAMRSESNRAWGPTGERFVVISQEPLRRNSYNKPVYRMRVIMTEPEKRTSRVIATYEMVEPHPLRGWGIQPYWIQ